MKIILLLANLVFIFVFADACLREMHLHSLLCH